MPEEVTPEDIRKIYEEKEKEIITEILLTSINQINEILKEKYENLIDPGWIKITANDLGWVAPNKRWDCIYDHLDEFYASWEVEGKWNMNQFNIFFTPREDISKKIKIDISTIKKEIVPDEEVINRADILDL